MPHIDAFPPPNKQAPSNTSEQPGMKSGKYPLILIVAITINSPFTRAKILMFTEYRESEEWAELSRHHFARQLDPRHKMRVSLPKSGEITVMATAACDCQILYLDLMVKIALLTEEIDRA